MYLLELLSRSDAIQYLLKYFRLGQNVGPTNMTMAAYRWSISKLQVLTYTYESHSANQHPQHAILQRRKCFL